MEMTRIESSLSRLETRLRTMIEREDSSVGISRKFFNRALQGLIGSMHTEVKNTAHTAGGKMVAPDQYTLILPPEQASILLSHPSTLDRLGKKLESAAAQGGIRLAGSPMLRVVADPTVKELHILADYSHTRMGGSLTAELESGSKPTASPADAQLPNAFIIVNGLSTFPLTHPVINIGSDLTNLLVLTDPGIAPMHAQLRFITDGFVIFNLDTKRGTFVNGLAVSSHKLNAGDIILIAGIPLVYGEERSGEVGHTKKMPAEPAMPEML